MTRAILWAMMALAWISSIEPIGAAPVSVGAGKPRSRGHDPYALRLTSYYQNQGITHLVLSNGSIWSTPTPTMWLVGDKVTLTEDFNGNWILNNESDHSNSSIKFERLNLATVPRIRTIENAGGQISLDDGSSWRVGWWERIWARMWNWKVGDHILIAPLPILIGNNSHLLIDADRDLEYTSALLIYR